MCLSFVGYYPRSNMSKCWTKDPGYDNWLDSHGLVYVMYITLLCIYMYLSHALKITANQRPGLPLHILRYATGMRAIVYWGPFENLSKASSETLQLLRTHYEYFRSRPENFRSFPNTSEHFRRFSENFKKS